MSTEAVFQIHLVSGYVAWALCFGAFVLPWLRAMRRVNAFRAMAAFHSFRFFGLVFIVPGVVGADLPAGFTTFAAYGDLATGVLAMLAVATIRVRPLFWTAVVAFNLVGAADLLIDYCHAVQFNLPAQAGQLRRRLRDPDPVCARADDHAPVGVLLAPAAAARGLACSRQDCDARTGRSYSSRSRCSCSSISRFLCLARSSCSGVPIG